MLLIHHINTILCYQKDDNKKVLQPIMKSEGLQLCARCKTNPYPQQILRLPCGHGFCKQCLAYTYHKHSSSMPRLNLTRCIICERTCELIQTNYAAIMQYTDQTLVPMVLEELEKQGQSQFQLSNNELSSGKQFKSHEMSTEKVTPSGKGFYSRCESPKTGFGQVFCPVHPQQQLSIICFSCGNSLLCISCVSNKKHSGHNIKTIFKGLQVIQEQANLCQLNGKTLIDQLELSKKKIEEKRNHLQGRWDKTLNTLRVHFENLLTLINRKSEDILQTYANYFEQNMEETVRQGARVDEALRQARRQLQRLADIMQVQGSPIDIIKKSTQVMQNLQEIKQPQISEDQVEGDPDRLLKDLVHISEKIEKLESHCYRGTLKTHAAQNWKSEQKVKDNFFKRVKTNVMSLNSSRDRKEKKCTKTEEDEKRNKSKANYKTQSSNKFQKVNKAVPSYLLQHLDKQGKDAPLPECLQDLNPLQSSFKSTSKVLSKSHLPSAADEHRRKKEHQAYIKDCLERKERKTFNATSKETRTTNDPMRKKKMPS